MGELVDEPGRDVHVSHDVAHLVERRLRWAYHDVDPVAQDVELEVGHECRDLDQGVGADVESGHLAVDPHQPVVHARHPSPRPVLRRRRLAWRPGR
jgi:hypothetical protein